MVTDRDGVGWRWALATAAMAGLLSLAFPAAAQGPREGRAILLVADPELRDPNFHQTVVLVSGHRAFAGPIGVILNRPTPVALARVLPELKALADRDDKVFFGGPVAIRALFYVFRAPSPPDDAIEVAPGVYLDWDGERLDRLLARADPTEGLRVFAGHSAWAPGQLEAEVARGSWSSAWPDERIIFSSKPETLWRELERRTHSTPVRLDAGAGDHRGGVP